MIPATRRNTGIDDSFDLMSQDMNRMLRRWWQDAPSTDLVGRYPVDISEDENHVFVEAELPGFSKDEIEVTLERGVLTIEAQRKVEQHKDSKQHLTERRFARAARAFTLPTPVDESKVDAKLSNGVLHLTLNKRDEVKPRRIEVK
jgi:HSP20 family protein